MRAYLQFLRRHPLWWLAPILLYLGAFAWLAQRASHVPENPFNYTAR